MTTFDTIKLAFAEVLGDFRALSSARRPGDSLDAFEFIWVVLDKTGKPCFVSAYRDTAMQHAADYADGYPEQAPWAVCKYVVVNV